MSTPGWSGRRVRRLINYCLANKGTVCHLCDLPGADSADHDPPRSQLLGVVPDPDALEFLWPSHRLPCNVSRQDRPITAALKAELRTKRLKLTGQSLPPTPLSPRFADRRPVFPGAIGAEAPAPPISPQNAPEKTEEGRDDA